MFERAAMFWQLQLTFGDDVYQAIGRRYRETNKHPQASDTKIQRFIVEASIVSGYDLRDFFEMRGLTVSEQTKAELSAITLEVLPAPIRGNRDSSVKYSL